VSHTDTPRRRLSLPVVLLAIAVGVLFIAALRVVTGASDIASSGTIGAAIGLAMPIAMAGLGGLWAERAGVVNIGLEGMMILGTFGAGWAGYQYGPWAGVVAAVAFGAVGGSLHALATVTFGVDHIVSGVAINILGLGAAKYLAAVAFTGVEGGGETQSPTIGDLPSLSVPGAADALGAVEARGWFFVSDLAALVRGLTTGVNLLTLVGIALLVGSFFVLWRTAFGLRLRACGESPVAAESLGVNVYFYKYLAVIASGGFAGLAGAFLAIVASSTYRDGQTGGRGYIGLAAMIFGNWRPGGLAMGAGLFGYADALRLRQGGPSVHALLLAIAVLLLALAAYQLLRRHRPARAAGCAVVGAAVLGWYLSTDEVPGDFTSMTPYVATLLVLALASQRLRPPARVGAVYRRGESG
jgi:simple sugar transport system permease protein